MKFELKEHKNVKAEIAILDEIIQITLTENETSITFVLSPLEVCDIYTLVKNRIDLL